MHNKFMQKALEQAYLGRGLCAPNPSVGAVLVHNHQIISEAYHQGAGKAHAEQLVFDQLKSQIPDATLYVTLEPCNHWGKTPPCVNAIIEAGIKRVVYAYADPNPVVAANNTPELLKKQGIEVIFYPLPEIDAFYQSYRYWIKTKRPWVTVKIAQTLDGKIAGPRGARIQLSNAHCEAFTHENRLKTDKILTTAQTVIQDNPAFTARVAGSEHAKDIGIIDSKLRLDQRFQLFEKASACTLYYDEKVMVQRKIDACRYEAIPSDKTGLDLSAIIANIGEQGVHDLWVEAGGRLFTALHDLGLVQRTYLYLVPEVLGPDATSCYHTRQKFAKEGVLVRWLSAGDNMIACFDWVNDPCNQG